MNIPSKMKDNISNINISKISNISYQANISIPKNVSIERRENLLIFKSSLGKSTLQLEKIDQKGESIIQIINHHLIKIESSSSSSLGLLKSLLENKLKGVSHGYLIYLQIVGVGYRVSLKTNLNRDTLYFKLGYSHDILYQVPAGLKVFLQNPTSLCLFGLDKNQLTQVAASLRNLRPPEVYKGKGIRYLKENLKLKSGKRK